MSMRFGMKRNLDQIVGIVHPDNSASQRVLQKLGLNFAQHTRYFGMDCLRYVWERADDSHDDPASVG